MTQEQNETIERWLTEEVARTYDAMQADPSRGVSAEVVFASIRARHVVRIAGIPSPAGREGE